MNQEILYAIILALLFLSLFAVAEILFHKLKVKGSLTRNIVHIGTGIITLLFPLMLHNHWPVLILCASFALILVISKKYNFLQSINSINRVSYGSILYPAAVYGCFLAYYFLSKNLIFFYMPVLIMAICDPVAALIGSRFRRGIFYIGREPKTLTGSASFFITALIISTILFYLLSTKSIIDFFSIAVSIAVSSTLIEAISFKGIDNITIPASVLAVLYFVR